MTDTVARGALAPEAADGREGSAVEELLEGYTEHTDEKLPLTGYAQLIGLYNLAFALFLVASKQSGKPIPERVPLGDVVLLGLATFRLSRSITKDAITGILRAPFTVYQGPIGEGEVSEKPRDEEGGTRQAVAELLTCPFCLGTWIAALFAYGLVLSPPVTRLIATVFSIRALADFLQLAYSAASVGCEKLQDR